ncbi:MAG: hypothetical protein COV07_01015 [Candidatus Vogelbacteria bacterium CG10_big_fil_rev_8_21_14_0_10_45_14]|uniref:Uncharacterized protein n=1 Tax=Candidatus Vogelbacteria bacterium CG10_big_fil_rev_8_21_14_0_10_45_14 TaxID=1975042 RepID=A0A2H0RKN8_9BACT|nr:MAG: hypothetical protein COV07_01015 [Candidatus Vogelbacteria bacterium CG10_big_fil_rev_8_21_14_0_10_45_14]
MLNEQGKYGSKEAKIIKARNLYELGQLLAQEIPLIDMTGEIDGIGLYIRTARVELPDGNDTKVDDVWDKLIETKEEDRAELLRRVKLTEQIVDTLNSKLDEYVNTSSRRLLSEATPLNRAEIEQMMRRRLAIDSEGVVTIVESEDDAPERGA